MIRRCCIQISLLGFCLAALPTSGAAGSGQLRIGGFYKNFFVANKISDAAKSLLLSKSSLLGAASNRVRLNTGYRVSDELDFALTYGLGLRIQDPVLYLDDVFFSGIDPFRYRVGDIDERLYPKEDEDLRTFAVFQNLDRAFVTVSAPQFDAYVGRQAIAWGTARVINPTDVLAPFAYNELDTEDRIGVDAVRLRVPTGALGEIDLGYVFGEDFEFDESAMFLRGKFYAARTDFSALVMGFRRNLLLGLDVARAVGRAGFWLEAAYTFADALDGGEASGDDYARLSIGADHSFFGNTYGFVEYHFNQPGSDEPEDYLQLRTTTAYTEGAVYLLGKHYITPGVIDQITPLLTGAATALVNITDPSALLSLLLEYNVAEDVYIDLGAFVGLGSEPELVGGFFVTPIVPQSEFGSYPDTFYTSFRVYF